MPSKNVMAISPLPSEKKFCTWTIGTDRWGGHTQIIKEKKGFLFSLFFLDFWIKTNRSRVYYYYVLIETLLLLTYVRYVHPFVILLSFLSRNHSRCICIHMKRGGGRERKGGWSWHIITHTRTTEKERKKEGAAPVIDVIEKERATWRLGLGMIEPNIGTMMIWSSSLIHLPPQTSNIPGSLHIHADPCETERFSIQEPDANRMSSFNTFSRDVIHTIMITGRGWNRALL
jgi:hypothetical protein